MHQVKLRRMPLLRTATGCRCRNTFDMIAMTRVRRSRGTPWRKTEFQSCELRTQSRGAAKLIRDMGCYFGFWILDFGLADGNAFLRPADLIQNPKSKIQNPFT